MWRHDFANPIPFGRRPSVPPTVFQMCTRVSPPKGVRLLSPSVSSPTEKQSVRRGAHSLSAGCCDASRSLATSSQLQRYIGLIFFSRWPDRSQVTLLWQMVAR